MKFIASKRTGRLTNFALAALLVMSTMTASVPFLFSKTAHAASPVTVTSANTQGWITDDTRSNGHVSFVADTSNGSAGALSMKTDANPVAGQDKAQYMHYLSTSAALSTITGTLGFDTKQNSAIFAAGTPSYQIPVFLHGTDGSTDFTTLVYEPYVDKGNAAVVNGIWQHWGIDYTSSKFYVTRTYTGQGGSVVASQGSSTYTLDQIKQSFPNAVVLGYGLNVGSNNPGYDTEADNFTFNGTTYNFDYIPLSAPTNLKPIDNSYTNNASFDNMWNAVAGATKYQYRTSNTKINTTTLGALVYQDASDTASNYGLGATTITRHNNGAPQATYYWQVRAGDNYGNWSSWSAINGVTVDTVAPTKPTLVSPSNGAMLTTNEFNFDWNDATDVSPVSYEFQSSQDPSRDSSNVLNGSGIWHSSTLPTSMIHSSGAPDGTWFYQVRAKDAAGNYSPWSDIWSVTLDTKQPTAIVQFPVVGPTGKSFTVQYSEDVNVADAINPANYFLTNWPGAGGSGPLTGNAAVRYDAPSKTATVRFITPGWYVSGEQLWGVSNVRDLAGNAITTTSAYSSPLTPPTAPGTPTTTTPINGLSSNWTWSPATDLPTPAVDASGVKGYQYQFTSGSTVIKDWTDVATTTVTTTAPSAGTYQLHVRALDNAGSPAGPEAVGTVVIDQTPPTVAIFAPVDGAVFGHSTPVLITGSTGDAVTYTLSIGTAAGQMLASTTGTSFNSYNWDTANAATGKYIATLVGTDAAGNKSTAKTTMTIDNTFPVVVITPQTNTTGNQPTITGTVDDANAVLSASFNGAASVPVTNNAGTFSFTAPATLPNGSYPFSLTATNASGNTSTQTATVVVAVLPPATIPTTTVTPLITSPAAAAVLGATTDNTGAADTAVKGATDEKAVAAAVNSDANQGKIFGIAWYWWILILAALAAITWFITAAMRRRNEDQA